ncbi:phthiocerol/phthiodiolone dimycocerosyl transferase family protein [Nocardia brasiliensis]|uniref:phthiocerol/phthiodiolone dimycocerosyl transferase family protein n=1 Tax=Nocardia brasiliensis TaxID=37326 RepID=UPI003D8C8817
MTATQAIRQLAPTEAVHVGMGLFVGYSVQVCGALELGALAAAFDAVRRMFPVGRARLAVDGSTVALVDAPPAPAAMKVFDGAVETVLHDPGMDQYRALCELHVVREGERANVTLLLHHSVADGHHALAVLAELWSLYTDFAQGSVAAPPEPHGYPIAVETLLAARGFEVADPLPVAGDVPVPPAVDGGWWLLTGLRCGLDEEQSRALADYGHRHSVTINGLVSAAIVLALAEVFEVPNADVLYLFPVDLRSRVVPAVTFTEVTNALGPVLYRSDDGAVELVDIARSINARLAADLAARTVHRRAGEFAGLGLIRELQQAPASALGTNWGRVPALRHPPELALTDFRPMFQYNPVVGVEPAESGLPLNFVITSFGGRLSVDLMLPSEPDDRARAIVAAAHRRLSGVR